MAEKNYYIILEVKRTATFEEIKSAYRLLAKKYHPDKNIGNKAAEEYFKEIQQAYAILSNPEKRNKYDLKNSNTNRTQPQQQRQNPGGPQYTGNAYQYAQQQAQYQQQQAYAQAQRKATTANPDKKEEKETWQILVSVGIALTLLYFIISYSTEKTTASSNTSIPKIETPPEPADAVTPFAINNYDSPFTPFFGEERYDETSKNSIAFLNGSKLEAIVCLVEKNAPNKTIRNLYISSESQIKMGEIPDGEYFLKIYFGNDWNAEKTHSNVGAKGGFKNNDCFIKLNEGKDALVMKKEKRGSLDSYSTYEIKIRPDETENAKKITAEAFFAK